MRVIAMIPARYAATRFPAKLMADLGGKPVIVRTYEATVATALFDAVYVVTDSTVIKNAIESCDGKVLMSVGQHACGTDRIAEAAAHLDVDIVVNVQGDEPFITTESLRKVIAVFSTPAAETIDLASLMQVMTDWQQITDPNYVKVAVDQNHHALYFSRYPLPYPGDKQTGATYFEHIGVYAFRKQAILDFHALPMRPLEAAEKIECLRFLEYGKKIKMVETDYMGIEIDTPDDLKRANQFFHPQGSSHAL